MGGRGGSGKSGARSGGGSSSTREQSELDTKIQNIEKQIARNEEILSTVTSRMAQRSILSTISQLRLDISKLKEKRRRL